MGSMALSVLGAAAVCSSIRNCLTHQKSRHKNLRMPGISRRAPDFLLELNPRHRLLQKPRRKQTAKIRLPTKQSQSNRHDNCQCLSFKVTADNYVHHTRTRVHTRTHTHTHTHAQTHTHTPEVCRRPLNSRHFPGQSGHLFHQRLQPLSRRLCRCAPWFRV